MSMRAALSVAPGNAGSLVLSSVPIPEPGAGEVLVRIRACGVNFPDLLMIQDKYQFKPARPFAPGSEVAGDIVQVGAGVTGFKVGDAVISMLDCGGMAEYAVAKTARTTLKPPAMPYADGAAFFMTYGTSMHALRQRGQLRAADTLLVLGAAGGVGMAAVQIGAAMGARVIAAASSQEKVDLAIANGAAAGIVYRTGSFDREAQKSLSGQFKQVCGENGADVIYDAVGGDYAEPALRAIAFEGRYLVVGFPAGIPQIPLNLPLLKGCQIVGIYYGGWKRRFPEIDADNRRLLFEMYAAGKIRPQISGRFALAQAAAAVEELASRRALGKVVLVMGEDDDNGGR